MFDLFKFFSKDNNSKDIAKERLKLVLVHDRSNCSPELLEQIKNEIIQVLAKYVDVDESGLDIKISKAKEFDGKPALMANIPIKDMKRK